ncbi:NYN domain-containing protein [Nocardia sp. NPDC003482]
MASETSLRWAVLIDADNASPTIAEALLAEVAKLGTAHVKRAYGDWTSTNLTGWKSRLLNLSIQPVQQFRWTTGRNATDAALIIDAMDLLYSGRFDGFCLVSSDSDFTRLAARLRESGLTVLGIGERKTPRAFVSACDRFVYAENLAPPGQFGASRARTPAPAVDPSVVALITEAVDASSDEDGWAHLGAVGLYLSKTKPDFDTRTYGYPKLKPLVQALDIAEISQRRPSADKPPVTYIRLRTRPARTHPDPSDTPSALLGPRESVAEPTAPNAATQLPILTSHQRRDALLRRVYTAWCAGEIETIGALDTLIRQHEPAIPNSARNLAINSLIHDDTALLQVLDPTTPRRAERRIAPHADQPEHTWIHHGHIAWLAYLLYRLSDPDPTAHLLHTLFDDQDQEHGHTLLTAAKAVAAARKTTTTTPDYRTESNPAFPPPASDPTRHAEVLDTPTIRTLEGK